MVASTLGRFAVASVVQKGRNLSFIGPVEAGVNGDRRAVVFALVVLAGLTGSCANVTEGGAGSGGLDHPTGPGELVLRVESCCGFVPAEHALTEIAGFSLFGDGRVVVTGPQIEIYPGPALPNLLVRQIEEGGVQAVLRAARDAGLHGPDREYPVTTVADAATTTFTVAAEGDVHVTSVYALGEEPEGASEEERRARRALYEFSQQLGGLERWLPSGSVGGEQPYDFHALRVLVMPRFPEGDEQLPQAEKAWPGAEPLATFGRPLDSQPDIRCGVVGGEELRALLPLAREANQLTPWVSDGDRYHLVFRPLLPDESGC
jgi:hypothetical protein